MQLVMPGLGLFVWMVISFTIVFFILRKAAWKPLLKVLNERETNIQESLDAAEKAKAQIKASESENEKVLEEARREREKIIQQARQVKDQMVSEAKAEAAAEVEKMKEQARASIENEKKAAINELKESVANLSVEIAEKLLKKELASDQEQARLIDDYIKKLDLN